MKRALGGGRKSLAGQSKSRKSDHECPVCDYVGRSDNVIQHLKNKAEFDSAGDPVDNVENLSDIRKQHTQYFTDNKLTKSSFIKLKVKAAALNPFAAAAAAVAKKKKLDVDSSKSDVQNVSESLEERLETQTEPPLEETEHFLEELDLGDLGPIAEEGSDEKVSCNTAKQSYDNIPVDAIERIGEEILLKLGLKQGESLIEAIADAVVEKLNPKTVDTEEEQCKWIDEGDHFICECCFNVLNSDKIIPSHLIPLKKYHFGYIRKDGQKLKRNQTVHTNSELHAWCKKQYESLKTEKNALAKMNLAAAELVVTNVAFTLRNFGSAMDYKRLNDKDNLTPGIKVATKNDGTQEFFSIREMLYCKLSDDIKDYIKHNVESFSVTLDKVTDRGIPYTVIVSYFFAEGRIWILLNSVYKMDQREYDGAGTAKMVVKVLMDSLGLTKSGLAAKCHHFVYDGVYATSLEREGGRGGLKLIDHFAEFLGLTKGDVTGNHDLAHNMQLAYSDVFKKKGNIMEKLIKNTFSIMSDFKTGKGGTVFLEAASEMNHVVQTNKSNQETRFVMATLRGLSTYMINLPTLHGIHANIFSDCNEDCDNTGAKAALDVMNKISDGKSIAMMVGTCQLLDMYSKCSLTAQHSRMFPTTVLQAVTSMTAELRQLGEKWEWSAKELEFAGFGAPFNIINGLSQGLYKPNISSNCCTRARVKQNIYAKQDMQVRDNFQDAGMTEEEVDELLGRAPRIAENSSLQGSGEIPIVGFTEEVRNSVEIKLSEVAQKLEIRLTERMKCLAILETAVEAFSGDFSWVENDFEEEAKKRLNAVFKEISISQREKFEFNECFTGYLIYLTFVKRRLTLNPQVKSLEDIYKLFFQEKGDTESVSCFIRVFQFIQIKSYSEAICETVGSIMKIHGGKGRNLHPVNFAKEIYLNFNLPPLHIMKKQLIPTVAKELVETEKREYYTKSADRKLKFSHLSSSIGNFRNNEEKNSHLPLSICQN